MPTPPEPLTCNDLKDPAGRVYLAAGSRHGDRETCMREALRRLEELGVRVCRVSSLYETEPVGLPGPETLLNGVFEAAAAPPPRELLSACLAVEKRMGRRRELGPLAHRPIDLDILLYGDRVMTGPDLTLPHPRLHRRRFVLVPLVEIAPEARHPLLSRTAAELLASCEDTARVQRWAPPESWFEVDSRIR